MVQVWAKRQFKTPERSLRAKYKHEFELNEKIVSNTLWARLEPNGRLVVGAVAKHQPPNPNQASQSSEAVESAAAAGSDGNDRNDAASVSIDAETKSVPPEVAAAECPDVPVTCPDAIPTTENGCRPSLPDNE